MFTDAPPVYLKLHPGVEQKHCLVETNSGCGWIENTNRCGIIHTGRKLDDES